MWKSLFKLTSDFTLDLNMVIHRHESYHPFSPGVPDSSEGWGGERRRKTKTQRNDGFKSAGELEQGRGAGLRGHGPGDRTARSHPLALLQGKPGSLENSANVDEESLTSQPSALPVDA